jgi:transposase
MSKALPVDLRERVVAAVAGGMSRREAAARFGVSVSSAVRWYALQRDAGSVSPKALGGDRRSQPIEAHAPFILGLVEGRSDITLGEMQLELAAAGVSAGIGTLWRLFHRRRITLKKTRLAKLTGMPLPPVRRGRRSGHAESEYA